ncbi:hypothetical protein KDA_18690 [Dictyobacter alpinus]|uniref:Mannosylglycerate hydrolase MGH1-like glycoside hydrolase domain-containing protein n=1 Tax=Dictyobacter alpinus TaxID=2014873 RepID=A0A402B4V1_9CHLR|nr:hypothetical protein [Dictyobacter alpinus]GCE26385.1 hypothetical protein KDA_18690 [Dictyobacter alpinus]
MTTFSSKKNTQHLQPISLPATTFHSGNALLDDAFRIAIGDIVGNIVPFKDGLLEQPAQALMAGLGYATPWTRDTALNVWNGAGLLFPQVALQTLLAVLTRKDDKVQIGGQYWDAISWTLGAWSYYLWTGDKAFLSLAFEAINNSLLYFEVNEFDEQLQLFRGPACYGDGVAAYPDRYARTNGSSSILDWVKANPQEAAHPGFGLPMCALSTNCLYYAAYRLLDNMALELDHPVDPLWLQKAMVLKEAINRHLWNAESGLYRYFMDAHGGSEEQEGMGHAFALLFGIADEEQATSILLQQHITEHGIPCVWPPFSRYSSPDGMRFGRHCGVVWPHIQSFWAEAAAKSGRFDLFEHELRTLAGRARRDSQFAEIYHPLTGAIYGGVQEGHPDQSTSEQLSEWQSYPRQTWSATGYLRMLFRVILGMQFNTDGITFTPYLPTDMQRIKLSQLPYRSMVLDIEIQGSGSSVQEFLLNGEPSSFYQVPVNAIGHQQVFIHLA